MTPAPNPCPACKEKRQHTSEEFEQYHPWTPTIDVRK